MRIVHVASGSGGNCHVVDDGEDMLMLDAGLPLNRIRAVLHTVPISLLDIRACLVTHEHNDHAQAARRVGPVEVIASAGTLDAIGLDPVRHDVTVAAPLTPIRRGSWRIMPFPIEHDAAEPLGFLLQSDAGPRVLYLVDTAYSRLRFRAISHAMIECNYSEKLLADAELDDALRRRIRRTHMSLERVIDFLTANDLSQLEEVHLLHLSDRHSDESFFRSEVEKATGAMCYVAPSAREGETVVGLPHRTSRRTLRPA